jgi:molybdopterin converting factor small subunit
MPVKQALQVQCRFFARYGELLGVDEAPLALDPGATVADAVELIRAGFEGGAALPRHPLVAVNREHALYDRRLADGDEVALLPPLAGG